MDGGEEEDLTGWAYLPNLKRSVYGLSFCLIMLLKGDFYQEGRK